MLLMLLELIVFGHFSLALGSLAPDSIPKKGQDTKLVCTPADFSSAVNWYKPGDATIASTCANAGVCSVTNDGSYTFSANASSTNVAISTLTRSTDSGTWTCGTDTFDLVIYTIPTVFNSVNSPPTSPMTLGTDPVTLTAVSGNLYPQSAVTINWMYYAAAAGGTPQIYPISASTTSTATSDQEEILNSTLVINGNDFESLSLPSDRKLTVFAKLVMTVTGFPDTSVCSNADCNGPGSGSPEFIYLLVGPTTTTTASTTTTSVITTTTTPPSTTTTAATTTSVVTTTTSPSTATTPAATTTSGPPTTSEPTSTVPTTRKTSIVREESWMVAPIVAGLLVLAVIVFGTIILVWYYRRTGQGKGKHHSSKQRTADNYRQDKHRPHQQEIKPEKATKYYPAKPEKRSHDPHHAHGPRKHQSEHPRQNQFLMPRYEPGIAYYGNPGHRDDNMYVQHPRVDDGYYTVMAKSDYNWPQHSRPRHQADRPSQRSRPYTVSLGHSNMYRPYGSKHPVRNPVYRGDYEQYWYHYPNS